MELVNATRMVAGYTMGMEPSGRELLVVVVKGTFALPAAQGDLLRLHEQQAPLVMSDEFFGEPGVSAPKYEAEYAPRKQRCDVLLNASAYAPGGQPADRVTVGVRIGNWSKSFNVVGDRVWETGAGMGLGPITPFAQMPITYDRAFGGLDNCSSDPAEHGAYPRNPIGRGFHRQMRKEWIHGTPAPNTEELGNPVKWVDGTYKPMSLGVIGRQWEPRFKYAGTYDQRWLDEDFPFLPPDFDEQYYQAAPLDQQLSKPVGEQVVTLLNLTADGRRDFVLPHFEAPVYVIPKRGDREEYVAPLDTILIEPDVGRITLCWRIARPLKKDMHELAQIVVGRTGRDWWQQREQVSFPIPIVIEPMPEPEVAAGAGA
jgi:hypothetical protein